MAQGASGGDENPRWLVDGVDVGAGTAPGQGEPERPRTPPENVWVTDPVVPAGPPGAAPEPPGAAPEPPGAAPEPPGALPPPPEIAEAAPRPARRRRSWLIGGAAVLLAVGIALVIYFVVLTRGPQYSLRVPNQVIPVGSNTVRVVFLVRNTGTATGTPTCTVHVRTTNGSGSGHGTFVEKPLDPGASRGYFNTVQVTNTTAPLMAKQAVVHVKCS